MTKNKIIRCLVKAGLPFTEANDLAAISVVKFQNSFILPYGFVQSSLLSTMALKYSRIGKALNEAPNDISISVYVDDILISTKGSVETLKHYSEKVCLAAAESNFPINIDKSEIAKSKVTIFNIDLSKNIKAINDKRLGEFLTEIKTTANDSRADSMINYVSLVNKKQGDFLKTARASFKFSTVKGPR